MDVCIFTLLFFIASSLKYTFCPFDRFWRRCSSSFFALTLLYQFTHFLSSFFYRLNLTFSLRQCSFLFSSLTLYILFFFSFIHGGASQRSCWNFSCWIWLVRTEKNTHSRDIYSIHRFNFLIFDREHYIPYAILHTHQHIKSQNTSRKKLSWFHSSRKFPLVNSILRMISYYS